LTATIPPNCSSNKKVFSEYLIVIIGGLVGSYVISED